MKLSARERYAFSVGAFGKDAIICFSGAFLSYYFTDVLYLTPAFIGILLFVIRIWDAVDDPIIGLLVDNTKSKYGKFKSWLTVGTLLNAVAFVFLFSNFGLSGKMLYVYAALSYVLYNATYTMMDIPYWSWLPNLTIDPHEREKVSVLPRMFATLAALVVSVSGLKLIAFFGGDNQQKGFFRVALLVAVLFVALIAITVFNVPDKSTVAQQKAHKIHPREAIKIIKGNDQLLVLIGILLAFNLSMQILNSFTIYYFKYAVGNENFFSLFGWTIIPEIIGLACFPLLTKKMSRQSAFSLACFGAAGGLLGLFIVGLYFPQNIWLTIGVGSFIKFGLGVSTGVTTVYLADCIDYGEVQYGQRYESIISSAQIFVMKVAQAVAGLLIGGGLSLLGYQANAVQGATTIMGLRVLTCLVPIIFVLLSWFIQKRYYALHGEKLAAVTQHVSALHQN